MINKPILKAVINVALAAVMLIMAIVAGVMLTGCTSNKNAILPPTSGVIDNIGNELENGKVYPMPKGMSFSNAAKNGIVNGSQATISATISPMDAEDKRVNWSVEWKNASSSFASGKAVTSYVTATPTTEYGLTATIKCLKDFGEQIIIKVTSLDNPDASASCTVDFRRNAKAVSLNCENMTYSSSSDTYVIPYGSILNFNIAFDYLNYTVDSSLNGNARLFYFNDFYVTASSIEKGYLDNQSLLPLTSIEGDYSFNFNTIPSGAPLTRNMVKTLYKNATANNICIFNLEVNVMGIFKIFKITFDGETITTPVNDVILGDDNLVF